MRIRSPKDFWAGLLFIAIAMTFVGMALQYGLGTMHRMGPGLFPTLIGGVLALLGAAIALRALALDGPPVPRFYARPLIVSVAAIALFGVTLSAFGAVAAIAAVVLVGGLASTESRVLEVAALALGLIVFSVLVFVYLLGLPIPVWQGL